MLRAHASRSTLDELETGSFRLLIDDEPSRSQHGAPDRAVQWEDRHEALAHRSRVGRDRRDSGSDGPRGAALSLARPTDHRHLGALPRGDRSGLAPGGAREHGWLGPLHARLHACLPTASSCATSAALSRPARPSAVPPCTALGAGRPSAACQLAEPHHVVVDGSEPGHRGRTLPSSAAAGRGGARASAARPDASSSWSSTPPSSTASPKERDAVRAGHAQRRGHLAAAGAIGAATPSCCASRSGPAPSSSRNDSFQEFHGEHPWLFDDGRLIGGKPVPESVGSSRPRFPIRGPKSRAATAEAKSEEGPRVCRPRRPNWPSGQESGQAGIEGQEGDQVSVSSVDAYGHHADRPATRPGQGRSGALERDRGSRRGGTPARPEPRPSRRARQAGGAARACQSQESGSHDDTVAASAAGAARPRTASPRHRRCNEPLAFINFVASFAIGTTWKARWCRSPRTGPWSTWPCPKAASLDPPHPLTAMGTPPPTKARQVLKKGEVRPFMFCWLGSAAPGGRAFAPCLFAGDVGGRPEAGAAGRWSGGCSCGG